MPGIKISYCIGYLKKTSEKLMPDWGAYSNRVVASCRITFKKEVKIT